MSGLRIGFVLLFGLTLAACNHDKGTDPPPPKELDSPSLLGDVNGSVNFIHTFDADGHYLYHCTYHTTVNDREGGAVYVNSQGEDSAFVKIFQGAFDPPGVVVKAGGKVRWQNFDDGTHHTVTSD